MHQKVKNNTDKIRLLKKYLWVGTLFLILALSAINLRTYRYLEKYRQIENDLMKEVKDADFFLKKYQTLTSETNNPENEHAMMYLIIAAHMNNDDAQTTLAGFLGDKALQDDNSQIAEIEWLKRAAEKGNPDCMYDYASHIGFPIETWEHDLTEEQREQRENNLREAVTYYRKAADQGHLKSMRRLAQYSLKGIGCEKDVNSALYWAMKVYEYEVAHNLETEISFRLGEIYMELGRADLAEAYLEERRILGDPRAQKMLYKIHQFRKDQNNKCMQAD